jgi:hypothetical protein
LVIVAQYKHQELGFALVVVLVAVLTFELGYTIEIIRNDTFLEWWLTPNKYLKDLGALESGHIIGCGFDAACAATAMPSGGDGDLGGGFLAIIVDFLHYVLNRTVDFISA